MKNTVIKLIFWSVFILFCACGKPYQEYSIDYVTLNVSPTQDTFYLGDTLTLNIDFSSAVTLNDGTLIELGNGYFDIPSIQINEVEITPEHNHISSWADARVKRYSTNMVFQSTVSSPYPNFLESNNVLIPCIDGRCHQEVKIKLTEKGNYIILCRAHLFSRTLSETKNNFYNSDGKRTNTTIYFKSLPFVPQKINTTTEFTYYPFAVVDRPSN